MSKYKKRDCGCIQAQAYDGCLMGEWFTVHYCPEHETERIEAVVDRTLREREEKWARPADEPDHDAALDRAIMDRLKSEQVPVLFTKTNDEKIIEIASLKAELARAKVSCDSAMSMLDVISPYSCPECGRFSFFDEDGCCETCGADALPLEKE